MKTASPVGLLVLFLASASASVTPAAAQSRTDFGSSPFQELVTAFTDAEITRLLGLLEQRLTPPASTPLPKDAPAVITAFTRRLQTGRLSRAQEQRIVARLTEAAARWPTLAREMDAARVVVTQFTVGKIAPDIVGRDLEGGALRLADYRGRVVVLSFSGEWCGICRSEYPYQRFLLDLYKEWPFALVSVESGKDPLVTKQMKGTQRLSYPSWWDSGGKSQGGPIARAWQVTGWPTTYVLDADGVIRFVDVRREDLLKAVRLLVDETLEAASRRQPIR
jgi:peroxiredoxin